MDEWFLVQSKVGRPIGFFPSAKEAKDVANLFHYIDEKYYKKSFGYNIRKQKLEIGKTDTKIIAESESYK